MAFGVAAVTRRRNPRSGERSYASYLLVVPKWQFGSVHAAIPMLVQQPIAFRVVDTEHDRGVLEVINLSGEQAELMLVSGAGGCACISLIGTPPHELQPGLNRLEIGIAQSTASSEPEVTATFTVKWPNAVRQFSVPIYSNAP